MNTDNKNKKPAKSKKSAGVNISPFTLLMIIIFVAASTFFIARLSKPDLGSKVTETSTAETVNPQYDIKRLKGYKYIQPLLSAKPVKEYDGYTAIKQSALKTIQGYIDSGTVLSVSVYFRDFEKSNWFCIDDNTKYMPGSLLKIPGLMTLLLMEEKHPGFLNKRVLYLSKIKNDRTAHIISKSLPLNKNYSLKELISYMIIFSDNDAALLLTKEMDNGILTKIFTDLGLKEPKTDDVFYPMTVKECSMFLETIFNASYLSLNSSEYALDLLSKTIYKNGMIKGIGSPDLKISHKFAEAGTEKNKELHETAIIYINDKPYLLTIMTKGNTNIEFAKLEEVLQAVAKQVYSGMISVSANNKNN